MLFTWSKYDGVLQHTDTSSMFIDISLKSAMTAVFTLKEKVKEESDEVGLKLNIQKTKIMASDPITSWEIDGETVETVETVADFIFWAPKSLPMVIAAMKLKDTYSLEGKL